ncbi:hypothetical protein ACIBH1_03920 [Nonomuraea sp. NPDC050663]|uniref:hypothetical protein n=1 Tax=Nonomuraea sp. NPDC050663 TaxID=3364370 RepID=UPI00379D7F77
MDGRRLAPVLLGVALAVLALGPALKPGFVLRYDMVFVPDPPILADTGGFPRAIPSDLVVALLSRVVPAELVQKAVLVGVFVLAATGAAALVPKGTLAKLAAAAFYGWNIYLAQRLLLGQWALLLGVAALPWAIRALAPGALTRTSEAGSAARIADAGSAARIAGAGSATTGLDPGQATRPPGAASARGPDSGSPRAPWWWLPLALVPAAVGGFQAMLVSALALVPVAAFVRRLPATLLWLALFSLPWLVPALAAQAVTDPAGVDAFAARADGPFGVLGSLLAGGGIWNAEAGVPGQDDWWQATARLLLAAVGLAGFVRLRGRAAWWPGLAVAAVAGLGIALTGAFAPSVLKQLIVWWPGFGPLRDGQAYLAPLVLAAAVGFGTLIPRGVAGVVGVLAPVLVVPTFALGAFGRLEAVAYPADWLAVQRIVNTDPAPGALLSLPWGAHRAFGWNAGRVILDPATKMFARRVLWDDSLSVALPGGGRLRVRGEAAGARPEVRYVLISADENRFLSGYPGWDVVYRGAQLVLLKVPGGTRE